jgi:hypothetical protein
MRPPRPEAWVYAAAVVALMALVLALCPFGAWR